MVATDLRCVGKIWPSVSLATVIFASGCHRSEEIAPEPAASPPLAVPNAPAARLVVPSVSLPPSPAGSAISLQDLRLEALRKKPILATNTPLFTKTMERLAWLEKWITADGDKTKSRGKPVISEQLKRTPENDMATLTLRRLLNLYNSKIPELHPGERPWPPLRESNGFNDDRTPDGKHPTKSMLIRIQKLLGISANGRAGPETIFEIRDALEAAFGLEPRLHTELKLTVMAENATLAGSPNLDPFTKYPEIRRYCTEKTRIIEPPSRSPNYQRDVALVREVQLCLIKLGYNFDIPTLTQTGIRDNATDEALKLFQRDFLGVRGAVTFDQRLIYVLVIASTGFDFILGATLSSEFKDNAYAKDPVQTYCGLTKYTLNEWFAKQGVPPPPLFKVTQAMLRACFLQEFVIPMGVNYLLVYSYGANRIPGLQLAETLVDQSYNRGANKARKALAQAVGVPEVSLTREQMVDLLKDSQRLIQKLLYLRAVGIGQRGEYLAGLTDRLHRSTNFLMTFSPVTVTHTVNAGIAYGTNLAYVEFKRTNRMVPQKVVTNVRAQRQSTNVLQKNGRARGR